MLLLSDYINLFLDFPIKSVTLHDETIIDLGLNRVLRRKRKRDLSLIKHGLYKLLWIIYYYSGYFSLGAKEDSLIIKKNKKNILLMYCILIKNTLFLKLPME